MNDPAPKTPLNNADLEDFIDQLLDTCSKVAAGGVDPMSGRPRDGQALYGCSHQFWRGRALAAHDIDAAKSRIKDRALTALAHLEERTGR